MINDSRRTVSAEATWRIDLPGSVSHTRQLHVDTGQQERWPLRCELPSDLAPGRYELHARVRFDDGEAQDDAFPITVLPRPASAAVRAKIALFDPTGRTGIWLDDLGIPCQRVGADASLDGVEVLIVGQGALTVDGPAPDIRRVREGMKVLVFERTHYDLARGRPCAGATCRFPDCGAVATGETSRRS